MSQGCSDAGFCTMGAMKPNQHFNKKVEVKLRAIELSAYAGINKIGDVITSYTADATIGLGKRNALQIKVPYFFVYGLLANTQGLSDVSVSATRTLWTKNNYQVSLTLGSKIPTNQGDKARSDGRPLPNYYQTSLGTYDGIAGISLLSRGWLIAAGYQMPFNANQNQFLWGPWFSASDYDSTTALLYPVCKEIRRGNDVMLRIEKSIRASRLTGHIGLLPIYRVTPDRITDKFGKRISVKGTTGLALSAITGFSYSFSTRSGIKVIFGYRLSQRYYRPEFNRLSLDGLSREAVVNVGYEFRF
ncbi:MAG: hypothetical protein MUF42_02980 [Cytophagaceae bacterium]|jgi:hypothetical protein|nr:hypothetical protein [Cytophagaceae bacterium]